MRKIEMVDLRSQYEKIKPDVDGALQQVIDETAFINGGYVKKFAHNLAEYLEAREVIPCGNGTDALQIALMALHLPEGAEVITTPFTFVATAEVIALLKLKPVFVDIDQKTFNIDVSKIEDVITEKSAAIIPVHLFGQACQMDELMQIAKKHNLKVVEDNAQAIGADYLFSSDKKQRLGTIGDIGCTSFYPTKNLGGYGDGGALYTNDELLARRIYLICNHGSDVKYYYDEIGVNSRLDTFQAAILYTKLKKLDEYNSARQNAADEYDKQLQGLEGVTIPYRAPYSTHVFHQYTIKVHEQRDQLREYLVKHNIPVMIYYPVPLHVSKAYKKFGYNNGDFPVAEDCARQVLSLPMHTELDKEQITFICDTIKDFFKKNR